MAKVTEKTVRDNTLQANQNSKHMLVGLQTGKNGKDYFVNVVARKTGAAVQEYKELSASEANAAVLMFELCARVSAVQINGLAGALENTVNNLSASYEDVATQPGDGELSEDVVQAREALTKFAGRAS